MSQKLVVASAIALVASLAATPSYAATAINEPLDTPGALSAPWVVSGTVNPSVVTVAGDAPENALRLTNTDEGQNGFALFDDPISVAEGIDVQFTQAQWGGTGADGIVFFVKDGSDTDTDPGATGGALGYSPGDDDGDPIPGISGALLGVGLDGFGNFASDLSDGSGCVSDAFERSPSGGDVNAVTLRGAGQGSAGYCMIADSYDVVADGLSAMVNGYDSREEAAVVVRVVIDPATIADPRVVVFYDGSEIIDIPLPEDFDNVATVKIGFSAGTGGSTDNHEIWGLTTTSSPNAPLADTGIETGVYGLAAASLMAAGGVALAVRRRKA